MFQFFSKVDEALVSFFLDSFEPIANVVGFALAFSPVEPCFIMNFGGWTDESTVKNFFFDRQKV
jgi:hypothetical protein